MRANKKKKGGKRPTDGGHTGTEKIGAGVHFPKSFNPSSSVVHLVDDRVSGSSVRSPEPLGARQTAKIDSRGPGVMPGGSRELLV